MSLQSLQGMPEHSPLGGSTIPRVLKCLGSVSAARGHEDPESEYAAEGTAAHKLGEVFLTHGGDAWTQIGQYVYDEEVTKDMADAVQVYLDEVRAAHPDRNQGNTWVEREFHCPDIHPLMYGRADLVHLAWEETGVVEQGHVEGYQVLHVWDYKHGAGIVVEVEDNPQLKYYAVAMLEDLGLWGSVDEVVLHICQPRGWMEPHRTWTATPEELSDWTDEVLVPYMNDAMDLVSRGTITVDEMLEHLHSGEHCRFCPARFGKCPRHEEDMKEMQQLMEKIEAGGGAPKASNEDLGRFLTLFEVAKIRQKAYRESAFARAQNSGASVPGWKLAKAKSNREFPDTVKVKKGKKEVEISLEEVARGKFGADAFEPEKLKSPAKIEKLAGGKDFAAEYAYKPDTGLQLVAETDLRPEAGPKGRAAFKPVAKSAQRSK